MPLDLGEKNSLYQGASSYSQCPFSVGDGDDASDWEIDGYDVCICSVGGADGESVGDGAMIDDLSVEECGVEEGFVVNIGE